jgi:hypothetical protein
MRGVHARISSLDIMLDSYRSFSTYESLYESMYETNDGVCSDESVKDFRGATKENGGRVVVFGVSILIHYTVCMHIDCEKKTQMLTSLPRVFQNMGDIADDGGEMLETVEIIFANRIQPPRITFFALDTSFHRKPEIVEFYVIPEKLRRSVLNPVVSKLLRLS